MGGLTVLVFISTSNNIYSSTFNSTTSLVLSTIYKNYSKSIHLYTLGNLNFLDNNNYDDDIMIKLHKHFTHTHIYRYIYVQCTDKDIFIFWLCNNTLLLHLYTF